MVRAGWVGGEAGFLPFVLDQPGEPGSVRDHAVEAVVMATYTLARWLIADGVVRASRTAAS